MLHSRIRIFTLASLFVSSTFFSTASSAQENAATINTQNPFPRVRELNWLNQQFLIKQRQRIEGISRRYLGQSLQTGTRNLPLLQRIVDENRIEHDDKLALQALGVVLGDILVHQHAKLAWFVYEDEQGSSHAVCLEGSEHCLFPVTMISRRVEVGAPVNVAKIYEKSVEMIKPTLPKLPFSD